MRAPPATSAAPATSTPIAAEEVKFDQPRALVRARVGLEWLLELSVLLPVLVLGVSMVVVPVVGLSAGLLVLLRDLWVIAAAALPIGLVVAVSTASSRRQMRRLEALQR
jgi:hypothetical protein